MAIVRFLVDLLRPTPQTLEDVICVGSWVTNGQQVGQVASSAQLSPYYAEELEGIQRVYIVSNEGWSDYWLPEEIVLFPSHLIEKTAS